MCNATLPLPYAQLKTALETARAAHGAVVARLAARLDRANFLFLEEVHQLRHRIVNAETFLTWVRRRDVSAAQESLRLARFALMRRRAGNDRARRLMRARATAARHARLDLREPLLHLAQVRAQLRQFVAFVRAARS